MKPARMQPVIVLTPRDNVATALETLAAGRRIDVGGRAIVARQAIPSGHKIALQPIAAGEAVVKYGDTIGTATAPIETGDHVHVHNVASARGRGDLR
jgi:altronate dehydratase